MPGADMVGDTGVGLDPLSSSSVCISSLSCFHLGQTGACGGQVGLSISIVSAKRSSP